MNYFIQNLLMINVGIAVVINIFIALRNLLKNRAHIKIICILWTIVFLRMIVPITIDSNIGALDNSIVSNPYYTIENRINTQLNNTGENTSANGEININASDEVIQIEKNSWIRNTIKSADIAIILYILGAVIAFIYILIPNILFSRNVHRNKKEIEISITDKEVFARQKVNHLKVYIVDNLSSPCLSGVIRPKILLNKENAENEEIRRYALYHETTHYKHKDNFIFLIGIISCIINWFNPFMWIALNLSKKDREIYCDESVVKVIDKTEIIKYGKSLLFAAQNVNGKALTVSTTMTGGKKEMKNRIKNIANNKKRWIIISILIAVIVIALIAVISITKPKGEVDITVSEEPIAYSEIQEIHNIEDFVEYTEYFDMARNSSNSNILRMYITDMDKDGTDEIYSNTYVRNDRFPSIIIECYDLKTNTYSNIISAEGWVYDLLGFGDKLYIFAINQDKVDSDEGFRVYEPYLNDGKLLYKEIDSDLERKIIDFWSFSTYVGTYDEEGNDIGMNAENILDISIYDMSDNETLIKNYTQEVSEVMDKIILLFGNMGGTEDVDINHQYKAVIKLDYEGREEIMTIFFGESDYITTIEDGRKVNWKNDGLRNYLNYLAKGYGEG